MVSGRAVVRTLLLFACSCSVSFAGEFLFKNVRLFDGESVTARTSVFVRDRKIASIGEQAASDTAETIDGAGKTLIPGLIDCHTHAFFPAHLQNAALFGVTTELDMMSMPRMAALYRQQQEDGKANDRADLFSAGAAVTVKKGHGTQFGFPVPTLESADEAQAFVDDRIEEGSDYIKIIYDDGKAYGFTIPTLDEEMIVATIAAAEARDILNVAHIGSREGARLLIKSGVDGLVHGFADQAIDDSLVELAKEQGVFMVPTMAVTQAFGSPPESNDSLIRDESLLPFLNEAAVAALRVRFPGSDRFKTDYEIIKDAVSKLHAAGVPILAGTDAPNPGTTHGISMHHELALLVDAGLSPVDALRAATSVPAKLFKLDGRGRIVEGARADLVLVAGDPTTDILATRAIVGVWKAGHAIDRDKLQNQVAAAAAKSAKAAKASADEPETADAN